MSRMLCDTKSALWCQGCFVVRRVFSGASMLSGVNGTNVGFCHEKIYITCTVKCFCSIGNLDLPIRTQEGTLAYTSEDTQIKYH